MGADRRRLAALVGSNAVVRRSFSGRLLTTLTADQVKERMPAGALARIVQVTTADELHVSALWAVPGIGRRQLIMERSKLANLVLEPESNIRTPVLEPTAQGSLFG